MIPPRPDEDDENDLWFLAPPPEADEVPATFRPVTAPLVALAEERAAQGDLAAEMAHLTGRFGAPDERLRRAPEGRRQRQSGAQGDGQALARAAQAVRRLTGGPGPLPGLVAFFARLEGEAGPRGADWQAALAEAADLHPFVLAAVGLQPWSPAGASGDGPAAAIEVPVVAARHAASAGPGRVRAPAAGTSRRGALRAYGRPLDRLARWHSGQTRRCWRRWRSWTGSRAGPCGPKRPWPCRPCAHRRR